MPSNSRGAVICTIVTRNYLHFAVALVQSVRRYHPKLPVVICVVDRLNSLPDLCDPHTKFIFADELNVREWRRFSFQYAPFELSCALKPTVVRYCLSLPRVSCVIYLDSDIQLYGSLDDFFPATRDASIVLTPHLLAPIPDDGKNPSPETFALSGAYNGGFVAVRQTPAGRAFIDWWQAILAKYCIVKQQAGFFVDQKPLDLVPGLFDGVQVLRQRGFHLAYWNLHDEQLITRADGHYLLSGNKLILFHFSGFDLHDPATLSKYQDRIELGDFPVVQELIHQFEADLERCGRSHYEAMAYSCGALSDGTVIQDAWREAIRIDHPALRDVDDPFDTVCYPDIVQRFQSTQPDAARDADSAVRLKLTKRLKAGWRRFIGGERKAA